MGSGKWERHVFGLGAGKAQCYSHAEDKKPVRSDTTIFCFFCFVLFCPVFFLWGGGKNNRFDCFNASLLIPVKGLLGEQTLPPSVASLAGETRMDRQTDRPDTHSEPQELHALILYWCALLLCALLLCALLCVVVCCCVLCVVVRCALCVVRTERPAGCTAGTAA